jgi:N-acetylglucosamine-6-phosphate deacetylase
MHVYDGVTIVSDGEVGWTADRSALASSVHGMDFMARHMNQHVGLDLPASIRMGTLTPRENPRLGARTR